MPPAAYLFNADTLKHLAEHHCLRSEEGKILKADACVSDPPYGFDFAGMGDKSWDTFQITSKVRSALDDARAFQKWNELWSRALLNDVLWPGAGMVMFGMDKAIHRATAGLEDAGYEIRHVFSWLYATGQVKQKHNPKPALEPIVIARKPIDPSKNDGEEFKRSGRVQLHCESLAKEDGRHPSTVLADEGVLDPALYADLEAIDQAILKAPMFFYVPKPSAKEREAGLDDQPLHKKESFRFAHQIREEAEKGSDMVHNHHPTVKPIALMRRLIRLVSRPGHTIIDPFMGSGTTGVAAILEGRNFIGIEREPDFFQIAKARIENAQREAQAA